MNEVTIYHNKSCGTSRKGLSLIEDISIKPKIRLYLNDPFTKEELKEVITELGIKPEELVRKKEQIYKDNYSQKQYTDDEWIQIMLDNPRLIERPIVVYHNKAVIGRPIEKISELLS